MTLRAPKALLTTLVNDIVTARHAGVVRVAAAAPAHSLR